LNEYFIAWNAGSYTALFLFSCISAKSMYYSLSSPNQNSTSSVPLTTRVTCLSIPDFPAEVFALSTFNIDLEIDELTFHNNIWTLIRRKLELFAIESNWTEFHLDVLPLERFRTWENRVFGLCTARTRVCEVLYVRS
jgi:hypothetical protein